MNRSAAGHGGALTGHTMLCALRWRTFAGCLLLSLALVACDAGLTPPVIATATNASIPVATQATQAFPVVPTSTPPARQTPRPATATPTVVTVAPSATRAVTVTPAVTLTTAPPTSMHDSALRSRICAGVAQGSFTDYPWGAALPGWYLDWHVHSQADNIPGTEHAQMVRLSGSSFYPDLNTLRAAAQASPGALWLIGNEPDVAWQDNIPPAIYATTYHTLYTALKAADPRARIAIGAVSQVTPLRLRYLEKILEAYTAQFGAPMPVDVWNTHVFVLREERDSWGVGLPPGMEDATDGTLWNLEDHARVDLVAEQVRTFRRWMAQHGQGAKPLIISEYGILMPADYGFEPPVVAAFMNGTFDYFARARDQALGDPTDDYRLVQRWCWYSVADTTFPTGNLFDVESQQPTALWPTFAAYLR